MPKEATMPTITIPSFVPIAFDADGNETTYISVHDATVSQVTVAAAIATSHVNQEDLQRLSRLLRKRGCSLGEKVADVLR
jgi:hypothetical protein